MKFPDFSLIFSKISNSLIFFSPFSLFSRVPGHPVYVFDLTGLSKQCRPRWDIANAVSHQGLHCLPLIQLFYTQHWIVSCTCSNFELSMVRSWGVWIQKGKYGKVRDTEIKWSIIRKSVTIIIFVESIDQLIDYLINCASLITYLSRI